MLIAGCGCAWRNDWPYGRLLPRVFSVLLVLLESPEDVLGRLSLVSVLKLYRPAVTASWGWEAREARSSETWILGRYGW